MNKNKTTAGGGVGFTGLLQVAFIVLKLCKVIKWSWWLVLLPTWISLICFVIVAIIIGIVSA